MDAVHRYEGTVNKVLGDGIMALFGAPIAHEDHAVRAAYAALTLQREMRAVGGTFRRRHGVEVQARVGLHSGDVVVGAIDNDLFLEYDAIGPTVHLANRMEQLAMPGRIHLTSETLRLAEGFLDATRIGPTRIKGLDHEVEVFELTGTAGARTRLQAGAQRGLTCFVGRDPEMEMLTQAFQRVPGGHGQIVAIVGEPGVGKSRLFYELVRSPSARDCIVLEGHSVSFGKTNPWHPIVELLKDYFRILSDDDPQQTCRKNCRQAARAGRIVDSRWSPHFTPS